MSVQFLFGTPVAPSAYNTPFQLAHILRIQKGTFSGESVGCTLVLSDGNHIDLMESLTTMTARLELAVDRQKE